MISFSLVISLYIFSPFVKKMKNMNKKAILNSFLNEYFYNAY